MNGRFLDRSIALVDDDPDILQSMEMAFRHEGARTMVAGDGLGALGIVRGERGERPELLVLDMMLPRSSGLLVLEKMQEDGIALPVIMVTANLGKRHREFALGIGARAYLFKPLSLARLLDTAEELLGGRGS
ncbi:MAG: response regulator transcription factor [Planctomycetota bacterium]